VFGIADRRANYYLYFSNHNQSRISALLLSRQLARGRTATSALIRFKVPFAAVENMRPDAGMDFKAIFISIVQTSAGSRLLQALAMMRSRTGRRSPEGSRKSLPGFRLWFGARSG